MNLLRHSFLLLLSFSFGCATVQPYGRGQEVGIIYHFAAEEPQPADLGLWQIDSENHLIRNSLRYIAGILSTAGAALIAENNDWFSSTGSSSSGSAIVAQPGEETAEAMDGGRIELINVSSCPDHTRASGPGSSVFCSEAGGL